MNDMSPAIVPKSDQINADDLISGPRTITIVGVDIRPGTEQPVTIHFDGEEGRPWKPCKSMSRLLVAAWGADANAYSGKSLTLYRDPKVKWAGMEVGGIRISHMSDIPPEKISNGRMVVQLTETRGKRSPHVVQPLTAPQKASAQDGAAKWAAAFSDKIGSCNSDEEIDALLEKFGGKFAQLGDKRMDLYEECQAVIERKRASFSDANDDTLTDDEPEESAEVQPLWQQAIAGVLENIAAAETVEAVEQVEKYWLNNVRAGLPDEAPIDDVEAAIAARKAELAG